MKNKHDPAGGAMKVGPVTFSAVQILEARPEWVRLPAKGEKEFFTGIGRSKLWEILQTGRVKSICLRKPGALRGARLVSLSSLLSYLDSMESEAPPMAGEDTEGGAGDE